MEIKALNKEYILKNGKKVIALKNINLELPSRGLIIIHGRSGSGKSTLINILAGLDKPTSGTVIFGDEEISKLTPSATDDFRNTYCGFIFQEHNLLSELSVGENLNLAIKAQRRKVNSAVIEHVLNEVGLKEYENRKVNELSGGEKQRVAIARALIKNPKIIFADEPSGSLDSENTINIFTLLKKISNEKLIILVTHDLRTAEKYGDRIIELCDGEIKSDIIINQLLENESIVKLNLIKSKLPVSFATTIAVKNIKNNIIRFCFTVFLSVISFMFFVVSLDIMLWDNQKAFIDAVYYNDIEFTELYKRKEVENNEIDMSLDKFLGGLDKNYIKIDLSENDINELQSFVTVPFVKIYNVNFYSFQENMTDLYNTQKQEELNKLLNVGKEHYIVNCCGFVCMSDSATKNFGYELYGRMPENKEEIVIPECLFNTFKLLGLSENDENYKIEKYTDVLGHKININYKNNIPNYLKIVGVVNTGCFRNCSHSIYSLHDKIFVCDSFLSSYSLIMRTPTEKNEFANLTNFIFNSKNEDISYFMANDVISVYSSAKGGQITMINRLCLYLGIVFFVVAFIFLVNYIKVLIQKQLKQIGIMSAMGINTFNILKIYGIVTLIICGLTFVLSLLLSIFVGLVLNKYFSTFLGIAINVCQFNIFVPIILLVSLIVIAMLGCFIPILNYKRKYSIENIINSFIK